MQFLSGSGGDLESAITSRYESWFPQQAQLRRGIASLPGSCEFLDTFFQTTGAVFRGLNDLVHSSKDLQGRPASPCRTMPSVQKARVPSFGLTS